MTELISQQPWQALQQRRQPKPWQQRSRRLLMHYWPLPVMTCLTELQVEQACC